jgi:CheY-like chemotaxis protein
MSVIPKVLIVDDDQDFRASVKALLESHGYRVVEAESGHDGLRKVAEDAPDVILLDIMMESSVEGYGITHSLRYRDEFAAYRSIPIIMVSSIENSPDDSFGMSPEVEMIRPDAYLTKPLDIDKFLKLLREAQRETIVVIDDDYAMRLSCRKILEKSGFPGGDLRRRRPGPGGRGPAEAGPGGGGPQDARHERPGGDRAGPRH